MSRGGGIPAEALLDLRRRLEQLPPRHAERRSLVNNAAQLFGLSRAAIYRALQGQLRPKGLRRADFGAPRKIPRAELERYCELVAALKIRTSNRKGRRLSTARALELIEAYGLPSLRMIYPVACARCAPDAPCARLHCLRTMADRLEWVEMTMRLTMAAVLAGSLMMCPALAAQKPPVEGKSATEKAPAPPDASASPEAPATPAAKPNAAKPHPPVSQPVDYGDMRCGFAVRRRDTLDSQIIAWAGGYIEGYAKANPSHFADEHALADLTDPTTLRTHIRGYCLRHRDKSLEAAVLAMVPRNHGATPPAAPAQHPAPK